MAYYVGVDAGGTKTECAVGDDHSILGRSTAASCKIQRVGEDPAQAALRDAVTRACDAAGMSPQQVARTTIGIAGASDMQFAALVRRMASEIVAGEVEVVGDHVIAMEAALRGSAGVITIAGTGSIAYGRNERGECARAGGWGPIISDEGSAEWIGRRAVEAAVRAVDTGQTTAVTSVILQVWRAATREDIVRLANAFPHPDFAALYPYLLAAADAGDAVARDLLMRAGAELAGLAKIVVRRLWPGRQAIRVCVAGGVFYSSSLVRQVFSNALRAERPDIAVAFGHVHPVAGALAMARRGTQATQAAPSVRPAQSAR
jgi:glucosamine kinase